MPKETLQALLDLVSTKKNAEAISNTFKTAANTLLELKKVVLAQINEQFASFKDTTLKDIENTKGQLTSKVESALKDQENGLNFIRDKARSITQPKDGKTPVKGVDYFDGIAADETKIIAEVLKQIPPDVELTAEQIANKLESLDGDARLSASAIKDLPEQTKAWTQGVLTATALYSLADVDVAGITAGQSILWTGLRWIPFTPTSGSGGYQQPTSGVVNGINTVFVFTTAPNALSVDGGRAIQKVSSDGTVNWTGTSTITLSVAPNFDVFAIA